MTQEQIDKIKNWGGFEKFKENDVNFIYEFENLISEKKCTKSVLMEAVQRGETDIVLSLVKIGSDVNYISKTTNLTPLLSIEEDTQNKFEIAKTLIGSGADVNFISEMDKDLLKEFDYLLGTENFTSALSNACAFGDLKLVKLLVENGANVNDKSNPVSCLDSESKNVNRITDFLIANGSDINSNYGELLKSAIRESKVVLIDKLTSLGAKIDIRKENGFLGGRTALMLFLDGEASSLDEKEEEIIFHKLWRNIENINVKDNDGKSLLFYAIDSYLGQDDFYLKIFDLVLTHPELDINLTDKNGNTALNYFLIKTSNELEDNLFDIDEGDLYKIRMMVIGKTNIKLSNKDGVSPKKLFIELLNEQITDFLKDPVKLINEENELGYTPLLISVLNNEIQKTKWLLKNGAIVDLKCKANGRYEDDRLLQLLSPIKFTKERGTTALMLAQSIGMIKLLINKGAYVDSQDNENNSVLMYYSSKQWFDGVRTLLDYGANPNIKNKDYDRAITLATRASKKMKSDRQAELINLLKSITKVSLTDKLLSNLNRIKKKIN